MYKLLPQRHGFINNIVTVTWTIFHTHCSLTLGHVLCSASPVWPSGQTCEVDIVVCFIDEKLRHWEVKAKRRGIHSPGFHQGNRSTRKYMWRDLCKELAYVQLWALFSGIGPSSSLLTKLFSQRSLSSALKASQWKQPHPDYLGNLSHFKSPDCELSSPLQKTSQKHLDEQLTHCQVETLKRPSQEVTQVMSGWFRPRCHFLSW